MAKTTSTGKSYLAVVKALHRMLWKDYKEGGWLPSSRELVGILSAGHSTCCKALKRMMHEHFICSCPQKGYYAVPEYLCTHKIGLIFGNGEDSPFLRDAPNVPNAIMTLNDQGFDAQIIQHPHLDKLYENAVLHGVEGLLWFWPPQQGYPIIQQIVTDKELPIVAIYPDRSGLTREVLSANCYVYYESKKCAEWRIRQVLARGHKQILYAGSYEQAEDLGVTKVLRAAGCPFGPENCVCNLLLHRQTIPQLLANHGVTAVVSEGGTMHVHTLLEELSTLPAGKRPEVFITPFRDLPPIVRRFPEVNVIPLNEGKVESPGIAAARMLAEHITHNQPLRNIALCPEK